MKLTKKQLTEIIRREVKTCLSEDERRKVFSNADGHQEEGVHVVDTSPLVRAIQNNIIKKEKLGREIPSDEELANVEDDEWAMDGFDAGLYYYSIGLLPEDIILPRKRYDLVSRAGWYLGVSGLQSYHYEGPYSSREEAVEAAGNLEPANEWD